MFLISQTNKEAMKVTQEEGANKEGKKNYDALLSGVKGSVDTVYIASGIWTLLKTQAEFIDLSPYRKENEKITARRPIFVKLLTLVITERNSAGGVFHLLYFPMEQRFELITKGEIDSYLKDKLEMTEAEINTFWDKKPDHARKTDQTTKTSKEIKK